MPPHQLEIFQAEGVQQAVNQFNGRCLLAADTGMGKTIMTLEALKHMPRAWPVLVVCPASVKWGWQREALQHLGHHVTILDGRVPMKLDTTNRKRIVVINYDILTYWTKELKRNQFKFLVLDECQNLANRFRKRTKACREIAERIAFVFGLSATPLLNRPAELFPILNILCPREFGSFFEFAHLYCQPRLTPWGWEYKGAKNLDKLHQRLKRHCMVRIVEGEDTIKFPDRQRHIEFVDIQRPEEYKQAERDFADWIAKQDLLKAKRMRKAVQLAKTNQLKKLVAKLKAKAVVGWINNWMHEHPEEKLVVFAWHVGMIRVLHKYTKVHSAVIFGNTSHKQRRHNMEMFKRDPQTRLLICNYLSAGVGVDGMQHASCTEAFAELPWRPSDVVQAEGRINRIGQQEETTIYYLVARGTIEEVVCGILQRKQNVVSQTLDGGRKRGDLAIHDQLIRAIANRAKSPR